MPEQHEEPAPDTVRTPEPTVPHTPIPDWEVDPNDYIDPDD